VAYGYKQRKALIAVQVVARVVPVGALLQILLMNVVADAITNHGLEFIILLVALEDWAVIWIHKNLRCGLRHSLVSLKTGLT